MRAETRTHLRDDPALIELVDRRVEWVVHRQGVAYPNVTLTVVSGPRGQTQKGPDGFVRSRVQIDSRGLDYAEAFAVAEAVRHALNGLAGAPFLSGWMLEDEGEGWEPAAGPQGGKSATEIYRIRRDYRVCHSEDN